MIDTLRGDPGPGISDKQAGRSGGITRERLEHLDMVRGVAALLVCVGHVRGMVLVDYGAVASAPYTTKLIYAATGLGHQAVIVFFALSERKPFFYVKMGKQRIEHDIRETKINLAHFFFQFELDRNHHRRLIGRSKKEQLGVTFFGSNIKIELH